MSDADYNDENDEITAYDIAVELDTLGFCVLPAKYKGKAPLVSWKKYQTRRSTDDLLELFGFDDQYNFWIACGAISGCVVIDCDNDAAVKYWEELIPDLWKTAHVKTGKGYHFYFKLPDGQAFESWSHHDSKDKTGTAPSFDVRGDGTGVIAPPSTHVDGLTYEWLRDWEHALDVPRSLYRPGSGPKVALGGQPVAPTKATGVGSRTNLASLLANPPKRDGGRNIWLTAVAGHYAKQIRYEDAFRASVEMANAQLGMPLGEAEVLKIEDSIWGSEVAKPVEPDASNGYLVAGEGHKLMTQVRVKISGDDGDKDTYTLELQPWANFDIQAQGVIQDDKGRRSFVVLILKEGEFPKQDLLEPEVLARPPQLNVWLSGHGCTVMPPVGDPRKGLRSERLQRYLESQEPPEYRGVAHLGWHAGIGFVVHEGIITAEGLVPHEGVMPHPRLRSWAPYRYGFAKGGFDEARAVLREILTFHSSTVTAVYASWWCANILKGQEGFGSAHWPAMVVEAPSESGKTRGFFALINAMFGCTMGGGEATMAATRDALSAHRNGLVWADDLEDPAELMELVRQATSEGSKSKKAMNRTDQETVKLVSPICISGESLGSILSEKAQRDRTIRLEVPSPVGRISRHGPYSQFDDIEDLLNRYDRDLSQLAGTVVQMVLACADEIHNFRELRGAEAGRHNDKNGVLRVGARVLARITKRPKVVARVDAWCAQQENLGSENILTTLVLPQLLTVGTLPTNAFGAPPVFVKDGVVWLHIQKVVVEWQRLTRMGERARDLVSAQSILLQLKALGGINQKWTVAPRIHGETPKQMRYHGLPVSVSDNILNRVDMPSEGVITGVITPVITHQADQTRQTEPTEQTRKSSKKVSGSRHHTGSMSSQMSSQKVAEKPYKTKKFVSRETL